MIQEKSFRLWQVAQEFRTTPSVIINILQREGFNIDNNPNLRISKKQYDLIANNISSAEINDTTQGTMESVSSPIETIIIPKEAQTKIDDTLSFDTFEEYDRGVFNINNKNVEIDNNTADVIPLETSKETGSIISSIDNTDINILGHVDITHKIISTKQNKPSHKKPPLETNGNNKKSSSVASNKTSNNQPRLKEQLRSSSKQTSPTKTDQEAYKARQQRMLDKILSKKTYKEQRKAQNEYDKIKKEKITERLVEENKQNKDNSILHVSEFITANVLAGLLHEKVTSILRKCLDLGLNITITQKLDSDTIQLLAEEFGKKVVFESATNKNDIEEVNDTRPLDNRPPIVTIMGHVDHGKTTLLDYIKKTAIAQSESGGITQHMGAYKVKTSSGQYLTFLDTPGHEAFTAMRARGCSVTDIIVIVVAADDSVQPQTVEALNQAHMAGKPIVFAINKIDKHTANVIKVKEDLAKINFLVEDWGGKYQSQEISATTGQGVEDLLDKIILEAEMMELKAHGEGRATGVVLEAALDKGRGYANTLIVLDGTLNVGDIILAGSYYGKIKIMYDDTKKSVRQAHPSDPVKVFGVNGAPHAGEKFLVIDNEKDAKNMAEQQERITREQSIKARMRLTLQDLGERGQNGDYNQINIIIKGDVDGSVQAMMDSLLKLSTTTVGVKVISGSVGEILNSDIDLAFTTKALIIGFNQKAVTQTKIYAKEKNVEIRTCSVIYEAIDLIKDMIKSFEKDKYEERYVGKATVIQIFNISKVGTVAGCLVDEGPISIDSTVKVIRNGKILYSGSINSLRHLKNDVKEMKAGLEYGINVKKYDNYKLGDVLEFYKNVKV